MTHDVIDFKELQIGDVVLTSYHPIGSYSNTLEEAIVVGKSPDNEVSRIVLYSDDWAAKFRGHAGDQYNWYKSINSIGHWILNEQAMKNNRATLKLAKPNSQLIEIDKDYADLFI